MVGDVVAMVQVAPDLTAIREIEDPEVAPRMKLDMTGQHTYTERERRAILARIERTTRGNATVHDSCKSEGISASSFYRWRAEQSESARLKRGGGTKRN